jgi:hypothetical protein
LRRSRDLHHRTGRPAVYRQRTADVVSLRVDGEEPVCAY